MQAPAQKVPAYILPLIVLSQFAGTSLWFAGNAILPAIQQQFHFADTLSGSITIAVQIGFIAGTLVFALLMLADRYSPVKLFMLSSLLAALFNVLVIFINGNLSLLFVLRFLTGFFLAGVYPVGMKIAADWYAQDLAKVLGWLVGALVAGTALPHWLRGNSYQLPWQQVMICTSILAATGGLVIGFTLKDGPHRSRGSMFEPSAIASMFRVKDFRAAAFGYFGHMWELYAMWVFAPIIISWYNVQHQTQIPVAYWSFLVIGAGSISCIIGGLIAKRTGSGKVAFVSLLGSGICCLLSPLLLQASPIVFLIALLLWGFLGTADSPQFSTLMARTADPSYKGTALTIGTCIGFAITIVSIQLMTFLWTAVAPENKHNLFLILALGPITGLIGMRRLVKKTAFK